MSNELRGYVKGCTKYKLIDAYDYIRRDPYNKNTYDTFINDGILKIEPPLYIFEQELVDEDGIVVIECVEWKYFQPILDDQPEEEILVENNNTTKDDATPTEDEFVKVFRYVEDYVGDETWSIEVFITSQDSYKYSDGRGWYGDSSQQLYQRIVEHNQKRSQRELEKLHNDITELEKQLTEAKKRLELAINK